MIFAMSAERPIPALSHLLAASASGHHSGYLSPGTELNNHFSCEPEIGHLKVIDI
jgi:hypothetical protein